MHIMWYAMLTQRTRIMILLLQTIVVDMVANAEYKILCQMRPRSNDLATNMLILFTL